MKEASLILIALSLIFLSLTTSFYGGLFSQVTGRAVSTEEHTIGPSLAEQNCMKPCVSQGCNSTDIDCMKKNSEACMEKCNAKKPEATTETSCMENCVSQGCSEFDFTCQGTNKDKCEKECNMIKEPEAKSEEEKCIRDCVNSAEPGLICKAGEGGEKGNEICQKCAKECEHLYAGPCLTEEKLEQKKKECQTCEHCYGEPVMGDSGEGYQCIVNVACKDATSEFGDTPGTGPGIAATVSETVGNIVESIGDFFAGIFGGGEEKETAPDDQPAAVQEQPQP